MKHETMQIQIQQALNAELSSLRTSSLQRDELYQNAVGGIQVKRKLTTGLVLTIVLVLATLTAVAVGLLTGTQIIEQFAVPMALQNDSEDFRQESFDNEELAQLVQVLEENGITLEEDSDVLKALKNGQSYWEEETLMAICRRAFGGLFYDWTVEEKHWFDEMTVKIGFKERNPYMIPEEGDMTFDSKDDYLVITADSYGLRTSPEYLEDQSNIGQFVIAGTLVHRTGKATKADADGITWSRVEYNGKVLYMNAEKTTYAVAKGSETTEKTETIDGFFESTYSITLPKEFDIVAHDSTQYIVTDGETAISIANSGEAKDMTIKEFAQAVIQTLGLKGVEVQEKDGVTYFEFMSSTTVGTETINEYYLVVFTVGTENNYFGTTFGREGTKADNEADFWSYAKTIKALELKD